MCDTPSLNFFRLFHRTDGSFAFCYSPPRLGEPQLQSATGRSGRAWGRFARSLISYARGRTIPGFAGKKMRAEPGVALMNELGH